MTSIKPNKVRRGLLAVAAAICLALAGVAAGATAAHAYVYNGCRWGGSNLEYTNYTGGLYYTASTNAASNWTATTDVNLSSASSRPLTVATHYRDNGLAGLTAYTCNGLGFFTSAAVYGNTFYMPAYSSSCKQFVYGHEFGHALGLSHASGQVLMYGDVSVCLTYNVYTTRTDDRNGINNLY